MPSSLLASQLQGIHVVFRSAFGLFQTGGTLSRPTSAAALKDGSLTHYAGQMVLPITVLDSKSKTSATTVE